MRAPPMWRIRRWPTCPRTTRSSPNGAWSHTQRGTALGALGRFAQAEAYFQRALRLSRQRGAADPTELAWIRTRQARTLIDAGRLSEAETALDLAKRDYAGKLDAADPVWATLARLEAMLALARDDLPAASQRIAQARDLAERAQGTDASWIAGFKLTAARIALRQGDAAQARRVLGEAMPVLREHLSPEAPQLAEAQRLARALSPSPASRER